MPQLALREGFVDSRSLWRAYRRVRQATEELCEPLTPEDCVVQSMPDVSPTRWHLAHTTWFFETFALARVDAGYEPYDAAFGYLFNSYYNSVGEQFPRPRRGVISRPSLVEILEYRREIDRRMRDLFRTARQATLRQVAPIVQTGVNHEQQHQELILTDIKHVFSLNPLYPAYRTAPSPWAETVRELEWISFDGGVYEIGSRGRVFSYDNERPRHRVYLAPFSLSDRLVTNAEYLRFVEDGGYRRPELWLSEGWDTVRREVWRSPLYWLEDPNGWRQFTLGGTRPLTMAEPVSHLSYFEADAFARWSGARLPTEAQWEVASQGLPLEGTFVEDRVFHPRAARRDDESNGAGLRQMFGDVWEWTASPYVAYPGYSPPEGALGEYNGKFMCNQFVLRGGSCATSRTHIRRTYRNFFPPSARWQFSGLRLAR